MKRSTKIVLAITVTLLLGAVIVVGAVYSYFLNQVNPTYHGKRVFTWADQAIWDEDPAARREASQALIEAFPDLPRESRNQLLLIFCNPRRGNQEKRPLPKEVIPFLIEAIKCKDQEPGYPEGALELSGGPDIIPALKEAVKIERDPDDKERLKVVLDRISRFRR